MNSEQKRYTIETIKKYKEEVEDVTLTSVKNRAFAFGYIAIVFFASNIVGSIFEPELAQKIELWIRYYAVCFGIDSIIKAIGNMSKKVGLENMISELEYQIEFDELDDKKDCKKKTLR